MVGTLGKPCSIRLGGVYIYNVLFVLYKYFASYDFQMSYALALCEGGLSNEVFLKSAKVKVGTLGTIEHCFIIKDLAWNIT